VKNFGESRMGLEVNIGVASRNLGINSHALKIALTRAGGEAGVEFSTLMVLINRHKICLRYAEEVRSCLGGLGNAKVVHI
jgi:hypothetical protein